MVRCGFRLGGSILAFFASVGLCSADPPRVWSWLPPDGLAAERGLITALVRGWAPAGSSPMAVADAVCSEIASRGLQQGEVGIVLLQYGRGTLVGTPADAVASPPAPESIRDGSPWTANGSNIAARWTDAFIAQYSARQAQWGLPSPDRWHMDCELRLPALRYLPDVSDVWGTAPLQLFGALTLDSRWSSELLRMNPSGVPSTATLQSLYAGAGSPAVDPSQPRDAPINRPWSIWWEGMAREAIDGALDYAFFSRVLAQWPESRGSDFASSMRMDGGAEPDGSTRMYADFEWWNRGWMRARWDGRAALQAPALYLFGETFFPNSGDVWQDNMRLHRANLDACLHSYGGVLGSEVTPWVCMSAVPLPFGESPPTNRAISADEFLCMMALLRGRGIDEFMLWPGGSVATWNQTQHSIDAAWNCELESAADGGIDLTDLVRRADRVVATMPLVDGIATLEATLVIPAPDLCGAALRSWIAVEGAAAASTELSVFATGLPGRADTLLSTAAMAPTLPGALWLGPFDLSDWTSADGRVSLRLVCTGPGLSVSVDLVQLAALSPASPDFNGDHRVDGTDLGVILTQWGSSAATADLDRDGLVGGTDLASLLVAWGFCGN